MDEPPASSLRSRIRWKSIKRDQDASLSMGRRESVYHITEHFPESAVCVFQHRSGFQSFLHWINPYDQRLTELKAQSLGFWRDEAVCDGGVILFLFRWRTSHGGFYRDDDFYCNDWSYRGMFCWTEEDGDQNLKWKRFKKLKARFWIYILLRAGK